MCVGILCGSRALCVSNKQPALYSKRVLLCLYTMFRCSVANLEFRPCAKYSTAPAATTRSSCTTTKPLVPPPNPLAPPRSPLASPLNPHDALMHAESPSQSLSITAANLGESGLDIVFQVKEKQKVQCSCVRLLNFPCAALRIAHSGSAPFVSLPGACCGLMTKFMPDLPGLLLWCCIIAKRSQHTWVNKWWCLTL